MSTTTTMTTTTPTPAAPPAAPVRPAPSAQVGRAALLAGALLLAYGVLGLVPGITTGYGELGLWGSGAQLFGVFTTSITGSSIAVLLGLTCWTFAGSPRQGHKAVVWSALTVLAAFLGGVGLVENSPAALLPVDAAANWLHLALGAVLLVIAKGARAAYLKEHDVF